MWFNGKALSLGSAVIFPIAVNEMGKPTNIKMKNAIATSIVISGCLLGTSQAAISVFNGGDIGTRGNWSLGNPSAANSGEITVNGNLPINQNVGSWDLGVSHTAGKLSGNGFNQYDVAGARMVWSMSGTAMISVSSAVHANGITFNISGGSVTSTGEGFKSVNNGALNISGGIHSMAHAILFQTDNASTVILSGGTINSTSSTSLISGTGSLDFTDGGSWELNLHVATDWAAELQSSGATLDGIDIDGTNINRFNISGGTITTVPESSSTALLGLGGLVLILRRRK